MLRLAKLGRLSTKSLGALRTFASAGAGVGVAVTGSAGTGTGVANDSATGLVLLSTERRSEETNPDFIHGLAATPAKSATNPNSTKDTGRDF
jgi:hypothetical protein